MIKKSIKNVSDIASRQLLRSTDGCANIMNYTGILLPHVGYMRDRVSQFTTKPNVLFSRRMIEHNDEPIENFDQKLLI